MSDLGDPYFSGGWSGSPDTPEALGYNPTAMQPAFPEDFGYAGPAYGLDETDPEILKLLRQQGVVMGGESALAGLGPNAQSVDLIDVEPSFLDKVIGGLRGLGASLGSKGGGTGGGLKGLGSALGGLAGSKGGIAALMALLSYLDRQKPTGGGTTMAYQGPKPTTTSVEQGPYGPIARYAATGGIMHAYRDGGKVQMEDGGFVLTKRAVDGGGGAEGIASLVPGAKMIYGPGTGTSDDIPAQINGKHGVVEARLSNGEAYLSPKDVDRNGGTEQMYATMRSLERRA